MSKKFGERFEVWLNGKLIADRKTYRGALNYGVRLMCRRRLNANDDVLYIRDSLTEAENNLLS